MKTLIKILGALTFAASVFVGAALLIDHFHGNAPREGLIFRFWRKLKDAARCFYNRAAYETELIADRIKEEVGEIKDKISVIKDDDDDDIEDFRDLEDDELEEEMINIAEAEETAVPLTSLDDLLIIEEEFDDKSDFFEDDEKGFFEEDDDLDIEKDDGTPEITEIGNSEGYFTIE